MKFQEGKVRALLMGEGRRQQRDEEESGNAPPKIAKDTGKTITEWTPTSQEVPLLAV